MNSKLNLDRTYLTDAGVETDMVFNRGFDLPHFASIHLLRTAAGRQALQDYFRDFLELAREAGTGCILESATWRASPDWAAPLGLSQSELSALNGDAVRMLVELKRDFATPDAPVLVSGCIGPRGDGYDPGRITSVAEARAYHGHQARILADAGADLLSAITMTNLPEAIAIAEVAREIGMAAVISFTVETDGRLPDGTSLADAIVETDRRTDGYPSHYMINCAHPTHFMAELAEQLDWTGRIGGIRANASRCSHAELDAMTELDAGDPDELAQLYRQLQRQLPALRVLGGCCGTDLRHVSAIAGRCVPA